MARGKTYILLGIFLYLLAGAPIWWKLTKIQRPNLPHDGMQGILTSITVGFKLPVKIHIILHFRHSERFANVVLEQVSSRLLFHRETSPQVEKGMHVHVITGTNATDCMCLTWRSRSVMHGSPIQGAEAAASVRGEADCLAVAVGILGDMTAMLRPGGSSLQELSADDEQPVHPDKLMERLHSLRDEPGTYFLIVSSMTSSFAVHDTSEASPEGPAAELIIGSQRAAVLTIPQIVHPDSDTMLSIQRHVLRNALDRTVPILAAAFWQDYGGEAQPPTLGTLHPSQQRLPVSAAGELLLSLSLCNADPELGYLVWGDFDQLSQSLLEPVKEVLSPALSLSFESQVLLYTTTSVKGAWSDNHTSYVLPQSKLPRFVDGHWGLNVGGGSRKYEGASVDLQAAVNPSNGIPEHVLHFVTYVPPPEQRPLVVLLPGPGKVPSPTNSFYLPSWGGVHILNPEVQVQVPSRGAAGRDRQHPLTKTQEEILVSSILTTLRALLLTDSTDTLRQKFGRGGIYYFPTTDAQTNSEGSTILGQIDAAEASVSNSLDGKMGSASLESVSWSVHFLDAPHSGFTLWEVDGLMRRRSVDAVKSAAELLNSLSLMVLELRNLEMPDLIGQQVHQALASLDQAVEAAQKGDYASACKAAGMAHSFAEAAFSNPAILAQLSYPPSHLVGVYVPLFLPLGMSLVQAVISEVKQLRRIAKSATYLHGH